MRPLCLEMTAFGSYAAKTVVPFEEMKHGLYLVTGDTGAGKTTIFDAIMFALYGVASGPDRKGDMLHCDYVPKSTDTVVRLRFAHSGREITVERRIHFRKKRGTDNEYGEGTVDAQLFEPDCAPIEGASKVTNRCEMLLGLNAEQFSRIIMLAQGEFKRFLKANSDEKNEILGKLFDNSVYIYYQNLIIGAKNELKRQRSASDEQLRSFMETLFIMPETMPDEEREKFLPGHPALVRNLTELTETETLREAELREQETAEFRQVEAINKRIGAARADNEKLAALSRDRERMAELEAQTPEMAERSERLRRIDDAFHKAAPAARAAEKAASDWQTTVEGIAVLETDLRRRESELEAANAAVEADATAKRELDGLQVQCRAISDQLPQYEALAEHAAKQAVAEKNASQARAERETLEQTRVGIGETLTALTETLGTLEQVDVRAQICSDAYESANTHLKELTGEDGLCKAVAGVQEQERLLKQDEETLRVRTLAAAEASSAYDTIYQRFIASQAGLLAERVRTELSEQPTAQCPVCGTRLCREHLPQLAALPAETPDERTVDAAKQEAERAERSRADQHTAVQKRLAGIESAKKAAVARAQTLLGACESWDQLADASFLQQAAGDAQRRIEQTQRALDEAKQDQTARDQCKKRLAEKQREKEEADRTLETLRAKEQDQSAAAQAAKAAGSVLRENLLFADAAAAQAEQRRLTARVAELSETIRAHEEARATAGSARDKVQGALREKKEALEKLAREKDAAAEAESRILRETGFASRGDAFAALAPIGGADGEQWLREERETLTAYRTEKETLRERIAEQERRTDGMQIADLESLEAEKQQLQARYEAARNAHTAMESLLQNHNSVLLKVETEKRALADTDGAWRRLERLAALAGGASSELGKLSFDRYVMGAMFREILEMANRRMELMSGGRYELVHRTGADRRNAKAGLEIEVLDQNTGRLRPSGSLSGGESFFTSLALALGLSDVVQNHAGGRQMDALFIDEGFGTLSDDVLDKALDVLNQLTEGSRLVGIISHVDRLDESIPQKIRVKNSEKGSTLTLETA